MNSILDRNVFRWVLIASAAASFVIAAISFAALDRQSNDIAAREMEVAAARAQAIGRYVPTTILSRARDWAAWNETAWFMDGTRPNFVADNLTPDMLQTIEVDDIILVRRDGAIVGEILTEALPAERQAWLELARRPDFSGKRIDETVPRTGFAMVAGRLHVISTAPIIPVPGGGTARGTIIMGREITATELSDLLQMRTAIRPGNNRDHVLQDDKALVHVPLPAYPGTDGATLEIAVALTATKAARLTQIALPIALIALTLMGSALVFLVVNRLITRRVTNLDRELRGLADLQSIHRLADDPNDDEIASLRVRINELIDHVEAMNADERRLRKQALFALNDARRAEKAKSNFLAITSHEVRNPLAAVVGGIDVLLAQKLPATIAPIVARLESSADRLKEIVNDVLDFSQIEQGQVPLNKESIDLVDLTSNLVEASQRQAQAKQLTLTFSSDVNAALVMGDKFRIEQILTNLIDNALKFTHQGEVTVRLMLAGAGRWRFEVKDTGIGINPALSGKLFDPYFQADQSTVRRHGGTGLGLAICRRIVTAMGGRIGLESEPGIGSTFYVELPLETAGRGEFAATKRKPKPAELRELAKPLSLLLVEDNDLVLGMLQDQVTALGHRAEVATNGLAALNAVAANRYDAVLMDMHMPVMDGITASHAIRALSAERGEVPIIAITADAAPSRRQLYEGSNFYAFLTKPAEAAALQSVLATIKPAHAAAPRSASAKQVSPILSPDKILELEHSMGLPKLTKHLGRFSRDLPVSGQKLLDLCAKGDLRGSAEAAHKLQGSALLLGAAQLQDQLAAIQALGPEANPGIHRSALAVTLLDTQVAVDGLLDSMMDNLQPPPTKEA